jgi:hypothetical protein
MEIYAAIVIVLFVLIAPAFLRDKPDRKRHSAMSGAFAAMDEVFHPAGKQATEQLALQTRATKPLPSPEDKKL